MPKPSPNGTPVYTRQHSHTPTIPQLNDIDLSVTGNTVSRAAGEWPNCTCRRAGDTSAAVTAMT